MVSGDDFKLSLSRLASGVTVVTYKDGEEYGGITVSSFTSLSFDPALIIFNLDKRTRSHEIFPTMKKFAIHILSKDQEEISNSFASSKIDKNEYIKSLDYEEKDGVPIFKNYLSLLICEKENIFEGGDHSIIIGKVQSASTDESKSPLLYYNRGYHSI